MSVQSNKFQLLIEQIRQKTGLNPKLIIAVILVIFALIMTLLIYNFLMEKPGFQLNTANANMQNSEAEQNSEQSSEQNSKQLSTEFDTPVEAEPPKIQVVVYVTGAVNSPGLYELDTSCRIGDAVSAAGGVTDEAAPEAVNQAEFVSDGLQIHIPTKDQAAGLEPSVNTSNEAPNSGSAAANQTQGKVNINTADITALQTLNGVGPATAQKILDYRQAHGAFKSKEELKNVSGIGDKKYAALEADITI